MARKTIEDLLSQANSTLADNVAEEISPADVRNMITDFLDTVTPAFGGMQQPSTTLNLTATAVPVPMGSVMANGSPEWTANLTNGSLARVVPASAGAMSNQFWISGSVSGTNNADVTVMLYKNGAATAWQTVVTARGAGIQVTFNIGAIDAVVKADATYQLMTKASVAGNQVFANVVFAANNIPVRSLT
jgi:hypothetical protein